MAEPNQAAAQAQSAAPAGFEDFFRASFRELVKTAMYHGATQQEAEDAADKTLEEMLRHWATHGPSLTYARRAVVNNFIKDKTRGPRRVARRLIERGRVPREEGAADPRLTEWEDAQWVAQVLSCLPPAQRAVMECIVRGLDQDEIAKTLGKTNEAVRQNLSAAHKHLKRLADELHPDGEYKQAPSRTARSPREEIR